MADLVRINRLNLLEVDARISESRAMRNDANGTSRTNQPRSHLSAIEQQRTKLGTGAELLGHD
jgi:hypothetical protein